MDTNEIKVPPDGDWDLFSADGLILKVKRDNPRKLTVVRMAIAILKIYLPEGEESTTAAALIGKTGGLKGGPARAASLSPQERTEIASTAAKARWAKKAEGLKKNNKPCGCKPDPGRPGKKLKWCDTHLEEHLGKSS